MKKIVDSQTKSPAAQNIYELAFTSMENGNLDQAIILLSAFIESVHSLVTLPDRFVCYQNESFLYTNSYFDLIVPYIRLDQYISCIISEKCV